MFLSIGKDSTNQAKCKINKAKITHKPHITQKRQMLSHLPFFLIRPIREIRVRS
jgi:hypothetical protein